MKKLPHIIILAVAALLPTAARAQQDSLPATHIRTYTSEAPLIYEGSQDLWPYTFSRDDGTPDGYSVDLVRLILNRLGIPFEVHLKATTDVFNDLKEGRADLVLGIAAGFHDQYGHYGNASVTLFTQSVVTPKGKPVVIHSFNDLANHKVIVNEGSLCHHLMLNQGWGGNAIPTRDIKEAMQKLSNDEEGMIVWNDLSLKWLRNRYQLNNLDITPVNMPHGEYKFMSNDTRLLARMDSMYTVLNSADLITPIQNKWFYPERLDKPMPLWFWACIAGAALLALVLVVYGISYRIQARRITRQNSRRNHRLGLILETSHVHIWTYDVAAHMFTWRNENGQPAYTYTPQEFSQRYSPDDYLRLRDTIQRLAATPPPASPQDEEEVRMDIRAKDTESGSDEMRNYYIVLSVLSRDRQGHPTLIIGTKKDVTDEREQQRLSDERAMRYWAIFNTDMAGIMLFGRDGRLANINPKACDIFCCQADEILAEGVTLSDILDTGDLPLDQMDGFHATQYINIDRIPAGQRRVKSIRRQGLLCNEFRLITVYDDDDRLLGVFAVCHDVTGIIRDTADIRALERRLEASRRELAEYDAAIDGVLLESDVRLVTYSPLSHTLTIYRSAHEVQHSLTQTRCMTLVDDSSKRLAMRALNDMDEGENRDMKFNIATTLRVRGGLRLCLQFNLMPIRDHSGRVKEYLGLCRDMSELNDTRQRMKRETAKVQEVEATKNNFVKNMVQEIRTPIDSILNYAEKLNPTMPTADDPVLGQGILNNADHLLHLIDNILFLSRLEAHMVEISRQPVNFAELFESQCTAGWGRYQNADTRYVVENPYEQLVVNIDAENLGHAIGQVAANAAQHTRQGTVRARYDYMGRRLMISIDDTGDGIGKKELARLNEQLFATSHTSKGLGLAISRELLRQMGGTLELSSEEGMGTTVYISVPCQATGIKRKRIL